jgi:aminoglycoside phosphotransferase (APT) family kinase protein
VTDAPQVEDEEALRARVAADVAVWAPGAELVSLEPLLGGASSRTYWSALRGVPEELGKIVVKVAPAGLAPVRNRDMLRQSRVLKALADAPGVAVPRVLFEDAGAPVEVPPLFAMTFVPGSSFEPNIDKVDTFPPAGDVEARALAAARMIAALHAVDPEAAGLGDEPEVTPADEVERWVKAFGTMDEELRQGADEVTGALRASLPAAIPPKIVHGDFRLGNLQCEGDRINAIIDWEIWARADPRIDLAWFLLTADADAHPSAVRECPGMPRSPRLIAEYEAAGGDRFTELNWFRALILFKLASVVALITKNNRKRSGGEGSADDGTRIKEMNERALAHLR